MGRSKITERPCSAGTPPATKKTPRKKIRRKKTATEENDVLNGWKKTPQKKTPIFKPADLPHFQNGADNAESTDEPIVIGRLENAPQWQPAVRWTWRMILLHWLYRGLDFLAGRYAQAGIIRIPYQSCAPKSRGLQPARFFDHINARVRSGIRIRPWRSTMAGKAMEFTSTVTSGRVPREVYETRLAACESCEHVHRDGDRLYADLAGLERLRWPGADAAR